MTRYETLLAPVGAGLTTAATTVYVGLMAPVWRGEICGHAGWDLVGHCPPCYAALAVAAAGLALLGAGARRAATQRV